MVVAIAAMVEADPNDIQRASFWAHRLDGQPEEVDGDAAISDDGSARRPYLSYAYGILDLGVVAKFYPSSSSNSLSPWSLMRAVIAVLAKEDSSCRSGRSRYSGRMRTDQPYQLRRMTGKRRSLPQGSRSRGLGHLTSSVHRPVQSRQSALLRHVRVSSSIHHQRSR